MSNSNLKLINRRHITHIAQADDAYAFWLHFSSGSVVRLKVKKEHADHAADIQAQFFDLIRTTEDEFVRLPEEISEMLT
jgi:hypothetical protein